MADVKVERKGAAPEQVSERPTVAPYVDIYENEKEVLLLADLPGVSKQDLAIRIDQDHLVLEGRRRAAELGTELVAEYRPFDFRRAFVVPDGIDRARIEAELNSGVLRLHLPKQEALQPRQIPVRGG